MTPYLIIPRMPYIVEGFMRKDFFFRSYKPTLYNYTPLRAERYFAHQPVCMCSTYMRSYSTELAVRCAIRLPGFSLVIYPLKQNMLRSERMFWWWLYTANFLGSFEYLCGFAYNDGICFYEPKNLCVCACHICAVRLL